jgi:hypothetical protein
MRLDRENAVKAGVRPASAPPTTRAVLQDFFGPAHLVLGGVSAGFIGAWLIVKGFSPSATVFSAPHQHDHHLSADGRRDGVTLLPDGPPHHPPHTTRKHHQTGTTP